jgi:hypothetical protein
MYHNSVGYCYAVFTRSLTSRVNLEEERFISVLYFKHSLMS